MVVARSPEAYDRLTAAFAGRTIQKRYLALVYGVPKRPRGRVERPIGRHPSQRKLMAVRPGGRPAITEYRCLAEAAHISLLDLDLTTGRTHQIRVHLKAISHPLIGDPTYGEARWKALPGRLQAPLRGFHRPALHAWRLRLQHPARDEVMLFEAPVPRDLRQLWEIVAERAFPALPGE
jgi:23S rRNA pseudouridine1911/1915/1917 synthase